MVLINLGIIILLIAVIVSLSFRFFWIVSIIFLYRFCSYFITYEFISGKINIKSHFIYFILILCISFVIHFLIMRFTYEILWLKYAFFILIVAWVFLVYDFLEIVLLKDWLIANGLWGWENIQLKIKELFSTSPEEFKGYFIEALNKLNEVFEKIFGFNMNRSKGG